MPKKRTRSIKAHATASQGPQVIEWACQAQEDSFRWGPSPLLCSGGFGSGKTAGLALKALWLSDAFPNNRGVVGRKVWEELKHTTLPTFFKWCKPQFYQPYGKRSDTEKYLRLNNGSEILWMHMENAETENVIRGLEINWFFLDQAEEIDEQLFDLLLSRLGRWDKAEVPQAMIDARPKDKPWPWLDVNGKPIVPTYAMLACNPDSELHWLYRRFHPESREHQDKWRLQGYKMFNFDSRDNKFLTKQNKSALLQQDDSFVRRFVEGVWGMPEGTIHKVDPSSLIPGSPALIEWIKMRGWRLHRGMDHGDASPTSCLWVAVNREGDIFVFREYYQPDKLISYHRSAITSLSQGEQYGVQVADPSIFHKTAQKYGGRWSTADEYSDVKSLPRQTALHWTPGDNDEMGTRNRLSELLRPLEEERVHPLQSFDPVKYGEKGKYPRLFFVTRTAEYPQGCDHVLRELRSQRRVRIGTDNGRPIFSDERDEAISDHAYDALRYLIASRVSSPALTKAKVKAGTWDDWFSRTMNLENAGGYRRLAKLAARG